VAQWLVVSLAGQKLNPRAGQSLRVCCSTSAVTFSLQAVQLVDEPARFAAGVLDLMLECGTLVMCCKA
jgi:hypothetical protein